MSSDTPPDDPAPTDPEIRAEAEARAARRAEARRRVAAPPRAVALPAERPRFSQPVRQVVMMLVVLGLVGTGGALAYARIRAVFETSPFLNGAIAAVFVLGVLTCFWQVGQLIRSVSWIERFAARHRNADDTAVTDDAAPLLLAPLAALLGSRPAGGVISDAAARGMQESVAARIEEARDITRYLANLLIFLGLLGTFYGLATTVPAVVDTIRSLAPKPDESAMEVFDKLMTGIEGQLGGMATAFSSSLLGLAGSLVVGLLELFVTHGQNRFYRELEEWMTSFTSLAPAEGGSGDASLSAFTDRMAAQLDALTQFYAERDQFAELDQQAADERALLMARTVQKLAEDNRAASDEQGEMLARLVEAIETSGMARLAEGQAQLLVATQAMADGQRHAAGTAERLAEAQARLVALAEDRTVLRAIAEGQAQQVAATQALTGRLDEAGAAEAAALGALADGQGHMTEALHGLTARLAEGHDRLIALAARDPAEALHPVAARLAEGQAHLLAAMEAGGDTAALRDLVAGQQHLIALAERPPPDTLHNLAARLSDGQERLIALAEISAEDRAAASAEAATALDEMRARLRSLDQQLARLTEANAESRLTMQAELRADLAALTRAVRRLGLHGHPPDHAGDF